MSFVVLFSWFITGYCLGYLTCYAKKEMEKVKEKYIFLDYDDDLKQYFAYDMKTLRYVDDADNPDDLMEQVKNKFKDHDVYFA